MSFHINFIISLSSYKNIKIVLVFWLAALSIGLSERTENLALLLIDGFLFIFYFLLSHKLGYKFHESRNFILFFIAPSRA